MDNTNKAFSKFLLLWSGQFVAAIGSGLTSFGLGVYIYQQTGLASQMAFVTLLAFLPGLLLAPVAGVLADRYDRRLLMVAGDGLSAIGLVFILICMANGGAQLWQICVGVTISSIFSSLLDPAYKATVTDLLTEEQYSKASGLVQIAGSAKYLLSPFIAGYLLAITNIKLLLVIDICTLLLTVVTTLAVRRQISTKKQERSGTFFGELKKGWEAVSQNNGVRSLVLLSMVITFAIGFIQTLFTPLILSFADSATLGRLESIAASGMLVTSLLIGIVTFKKGYVKMLALSLFFAGIFMAGFGLQENIFLITVSGFLFFAMLPFANTALDYLLRTNIDNSLQGRAWGIIGIVSQLGYVVAYMLCGVLADYLFTPMLVEGGVLTGSIGKIIGVGSGRGTGLLIILAGFLLCITALVLYQSRAVKGLEEY
ncbi:DHA3 family macrolide efflux protein-like MFS transporter [Aequitasia blattaphilus]|uniref:MFS transporter n=1 Tax=Aequitasia blattaphilus TaxID=2949332 RepID=A0ABT1EGB2_9FIRM|nr:MFS transporter [Aequitasia blattaphilus]MCP1103507.1 MFS transporter [Aequitasia blattaphilus]MCR8616147.1 MFS transporter [Aequitasia blattaphilus]